MILVGDLLDLINSKNGNIKIKVILPDKTYAYTSKFCFIQDGMLIFPLNQSETSITATLSTVKEIIDAQLNNKKQNFLDYEISVTYEDTSDLYMVKDLRVEDSYVFLLCEEECDDIEEISCNKTLQDSGIRTKFFNVVNVISHIICPVLMCCGLIMILFSYIKSTTLKEVGTYLHNCHNKIIVENNEYNMPEISISDKICIACNKPVTSDSIIIVTYDSKCMQCESEMLSDTKYCSQCGTQRQLKYQKCTETQFQSLKDAYHRTYGCGIVIAIVGLIVGICAMIMAVGEVTHKKS